MTISEKDVIGSLQEQLSEKDKEIAKLKDELEAYKMKEQSFEDLLSSRLPQIQERGIPEDDIPARYHMTREYTMAIEWTMYSCDRCKPLLGKKRVKQMEDRFNSLPAKHRIWPHRKLGEDPNK